MRKSVLTIVLISLAVSGVWAQKRQSPVKKPTPKTVPIKSITEIPAADWGLLSEALQKENWNKSAELAWQYLQKLSTDNSQKQLAQLRYIYLFSLAGKILEFNKTGNATEAEKTWTELDRVLETFIGKEFLLTARPFSLECGKKLNYICQVKNQPNALRITATNQEGNAIHSFDYVLFDASVNLKDFDEKPAFVGGTLQKAEYNEDKSKPWVIRLFFNKGFVRVNLRK
jgi:hypothetical protein